MAILVARLKLAWQVASTYWRANLGIGDKSFLEKLMHRIQVLWVPSEDSLD